MINRNYLPYKSAREYYDRGMAKWMGFFISEHSTALSKGGDSIDFTDYIDEEEKLFFLSQAYINKKRILLYTSIQNEPFLGNICELTKEKLYFSANSKTKVFLYPQILKLTVAEVVENE